MEITTVASNYHIEVNPSDVGIYDYVVVQEIIKEIAQYKQLDAIRKDIQGLYVLPRENDPYTWDGVIFVSTGVWEEGIFKFTLQIPKEYSL